MIATSGIYKLLLVLHLLAVIIGFGPVFMAAAFAVKAKARGGSEGLAVAEVLNEVLSTFAEWVIYAVPVLGICLILASNDAWKFSQTWISAALGIYVVALGIVHGVHLPNIRKLNALMAEAVAAKSAGGGAPPQLAEIEQRDKKAAMIGGLLNLLIVVEVVLMVWKPGAHGG